MNIFGKTEKYIGMYLLVLMVVVVIAATAEIAYEIVIDLIRPPGLFLLLIINSVFLMHQRRRIISQVARLSNEFALDAVRRCRDDGWLQSGNMNGMRFAGARIGVVTLPIKLWVGVATALCTAKSQRWQLTRSR